GAHSIMLRRVAGQRTPAAANIEKRFPTFQPQLAADHLEFVSLRLVDVIGPIGEIGTRVNHVPVEPEGVKRVGYIVMVADVLLVLLWPSLVPPLAWYVFQRPRTAARDEQE